MNESERGGRSNSPPRTSAGEGNGNDLSRALYRLDKLCNRLTEDYQAAWGQPVDMSDISDFPGEPRQTGTMVPVPVAARGVSAYPQAISILYINDIERREIVADSRLMAQTNPFCIGAARNRVAYTVGTGHKYKVSLVDPDAMEPNEGESLLSDCRNVIDQFMARNRWAARQKETVRRLDRDGEAFRRFFIDEQEAEVNVRFIEPLCVQDPGSKPSGSHIYFGVEFKSYDNGVDMETPVAFWVKDIGALGEGQSESAKIDGSEVQHLKANVDLDSPRGLPTWYALRNHFNRALKLLRNIVTVADVQSSIAMIRKHVGATRDMVRRAIDAQAPSQAVDQTGRTENVRDYRPGSILDLPEITDLQFPQAGIDVSRYAAGIQAELRAVGAALAMPEYMVSGDASNANYSSTMVAEGPAVKTFEELQQDLIETDLMVIKLQLAVSAKAGTLPDNVLDLVKIEAEPPIIKSENRLQEVQADVALVGAGAMSKDTLAARHGMEFEDEQNKIEADKDQGVGYGEIPAMAAGGEKQPGEPGAHGQQLDADGNLIPPNMTQQGDTAAGGKVPQGAATEPNVVKEGDPLQEYNDLHHTDGTFTDPATFAHVAGRKAAATGKPEDHKAASAAFTRAAAKARKDGDEAQATVHEGYAAMHGAKAEIAPATAETATTPILEVPDVRQENHFECGAACTAAVGRYFGVGPATLAEWANALGTTVEKSTSPQAIVDYLTKLGLTVEARDGMTLADLQAAIAAKKPVICPGQYYMDRRDPKAAWNYGHYQTAVGVLLGLVIVQDPSLENLERQPGGDVPAKQADAESSGAAPGLKLITAKDWLDRWHDVDQSGRRLVRFGIVVGPGEKP